ncbi:molybdenum cofactor biosynthesis protein MoaE, partial [Oleiphilus sp. HI0080]
GAICMFTGLVREFGDQSDVQAIELEHYPGMTEKQLQNIVDQAKQRWPILASCIIHRIGMLKLDEQIVAVAVSSSHREAAFEACSFIMDYLKRDATIWKKEVAEEAHWVEAKQSDAAKADSWNT